MAKPPAFQFYVRDYLTDDALQGCSLAARGFWMQMLCHMHLAEERGVLTKSVQQFARLAGCSAQEVAEIILELKDAGAAEVCSASDLRQGLTHPDFVLTLKNRRMVKEDLERKSHADRQKRYDERRRQAADAKSDAKVTVPSASASASASAQHTPKPPSRGLLFEGQDGGKSKAKPTRKQPAEKPETTTIVEWFCEEFKQRFGVAYNVAWGRDAAMVKGLLKTYQTEDIKNAATAMMVSDFWGPKASIPMLASHRFTEFLAASKGVVPKSAPRDQAPAPSGIAYRSFEEVMREQGILK